MAEKYVFVPTETGIREELVDYEYFGGFSLAQKQRCINSLHEAYRKDHPNAEILEISSKSPVRLGTFLSAFNLESYWNPKISVEQVFQASKVFENGGPYLDLLEKEPGEAKTDERLKNSGNLIAFELDGVRYPIEPKTAFYDWLYVKSIAANKYYSTKLTYYNAFTDIMFNHNKQINCQARAAAIFVSLSKQGVLEEKLKDFESFKSFYLTE